MRSEESIRRADLCVLVIDASAGVTAQDRQIAGLIQRANKPVVVAINKWDLLVAAARRNARLPRAMACQRGSRVVLPAGMRRWWRCRRCAANRWAGSLPPSKRPAARLPSGSVRGPLNRLFKAAMELQPPPMRQNRRFKMLYATQVEDKRGTTIPVPVFLLFVNDPALLTDTYRKYLENKLRGAFPFPGLPILLKQRGRESKEPHGQ